MARIAARWPSGFDVASASTRRLALAALVIVAGYVLVSPVRDFYSQRDRQLASEGELADAHAEKTELEAVLARHQSDEYLEELARTKLGLVGVGEETFIIAESNSGRPADTVNAGESRGTLAEEQTAPLGEAEPAAGGPENADEPTPDPAVAATDEAAEDATESSDGPPVTRDPLLFPNG